MADKRIIEQTATSEVFVDDWLVKDSSTEGTTKIRPSNLKDYIAAGLVPETMVADEYVTTSTYYSGDICIYEGVLYKALEDDITGDWDSTKWDAITISSELENSGTGNVADVYVNGVSVVDEGVAEITVPEDAEDIAYDNTTSHAQATNTQSAIDEAFSRTVDLAGAISSISASPYSTQHSYHVGDYAMYDYKLYRCISDTSGAWDSTKWEEVKVTDELQELDENKADTDGFYDELFAGNLVTDMHTADNTAYLYRQSPSASSVSQNIVGGTVAWNQLAPTSNLPSITTFSNGVYTLNYTPTGTASRQIVGSATYSANHVIYVDVKFKKTYDNVPTFRLYSPATGSYYGAYFDTSKAQVLKNESTNIQLWQNYVEANKEYKLDFCYTIIDLTQAFGSTIADYIYSLDQAEAGSGIAWLKSYGFLTKDYYAYQSGKLESVNVASRKIVGKNLFDKATNVLNGYMTSDGTFKASNSGEKTFYCKVPKGTITMGKPVGTSVLRGVLFDEIPSNNDVGYEVLQYESNAKQTFTTTKETYYVCYCYNNTGESNTWQSVLDSIQVEVGSTATAYELYNPTTYPLSLIDLRGIPKLDSNNQLYFDGDVYESDGSVKRRYGSYTFTGNESWTQIGTDNVYYSEISGVSNLIKKPATGSVKCGMVAIVEELTYGEMNSVGETIEGIGAIYSNGRIVITKKLYDNKSKLTGTELAFPLTTPTSENADAYENPQLVGSTEEFIDTRDVPIPVGGERKYYTDLKAKLEELAKIPDVPTTNGTYTLKATRSASGVVYSWVSG